MNYSEEQRDSIGIVEKQYNLDYKQPKTALYKLTSEEAKTLNKLIKEISLNQKADFYSEFPMGDGFGYDFQILFGDGKVEDVEIQNLNISTYENLVFQVLKYDEKYEKDENNMKVLENFKDWNYTKYLDIL